MSAAIQPTPIKNCVITYNLNDSNKNSLEMPAKESAIIRAYHDLINKLVESKTNGAWIIDAEHIDGRYQSHNGDYQFTASRYYPIDEELHSCTVELLGVNEFSTDLSTIAVKLNRNGRADFVSHKTISTEQLLKKGAESGANEVNRLVETMLYSLYNDKIWDVNLKEMDFDINLIKNNFLKRYYPESAMIHITDIDVVSFKSYRGKHTAYAKYKFKDKDCITSFDLNQYFSLLLKIERINHNQDRHLVRSHAG